MRFQLLLACLVWVSCFASVYGQARAEPVIPEGVAVTPQIEGAAQQAVQLLGNEVLKGNFAYAVSKMYPRWKVRQAKRLGDEQKLLDQFNKAGAQMQEAGIDITGFSAQKPLVFYRVWPVRVDKSKAVGSGGALNYHLLALVPTKMTMRFLLEGKPPRTFIRTSFQVAISEEGTNDWTFIDGSTIKRTDLRSMFPLLPADLVLPKRVDEEKK